MAAKGDVIYPDFRGDADTIQAMEQELNEFLRIAEGDAPKGVLDWMFGSDLAAKRSRAEQMRDEINGWGDEASEPWLTPLITAVEALDDLAAAIGEAVERGDAGEMSAPPERIATKDDGRDYQAEIEAARGQLEALYDRAESLTTEEVADESDRNEILQELLDISRQLLDLYFKVPVSDHNANPIPEGQQLSSDISAVQAWLDDQFGAIQSGSAPTLHSRPINAEIAALSAQVAALERAA